MSPSVSGASSAPTRTVRLPWVLLTLTLVLVLVLVAIPGQELNPDNTEFAGGTTPLAVEGVAIQVVFNVGIMMVLAGLVASVVSVVVRYRRAVGVERLQQPAHVSLWLRGPQAAR